MIGWPTQMSGSGREALHNVWEWSRDLAGCPELVVRPSRVSESGREARPDVCEWSGVCRNCPGLV